MKSLKEEFLVIGKPDISEQEEKSVTDVLRSGWLGYGRVAKMFEKEFSEFLHVKNAIAVNSCTMGLMLALRAENIGQGDEVITTPLTFAATVNAILATGAKPVFVDVKEDGTLDADEIIRSIALSKRTKAIIPVHIWGTPCEMNEITKIARMFKWVVIEDAAHAFGGDICETPLGCCSDYGVFSFYPTKNITSGDGGMIVTWHDDKAKKIRTMAAQGMSAGAWKRYQPGPVINYEVTSEGYKGLMNDISASIGLTQLRRWPELKEKREKVFKIYENSFGKMKRGHSQHLYEIRVDNRTEFRNKLYKLNIGTGVHYNPLHLEPAYRFLGYKKGDFPIAEKIGYQTVSLPLSSTMTEEDAFRVVEAVRSVWNQE